MEARACAILAGHQRPARTRSQGRRSRPASRPRARPSPSTASRPKDTSGSLPTWARWPSPSACVRAFAIAVPIRDVLETVLQARSRFSARFGRSRARPLVLQGAWAVRRRQAQIRSAPAQGAGLQPAERHHAPVPRRNTDRAESKGGSAQGSSRPPSPRRTIRSGCRKIACSGEQAQAAATLN